MCNSERVFFCLFKYLNQQLNYFCLVDHGLNNDTDDLLGLRVSFREMVGQSLEEKGLIDGQQIGQPLVLVVGDAGDSEEVVDDVWG